MTKNKWILSVTALAAIAANATLALASPDYVFVNTDVYLKLVDLNTLTSQSVTLKPPTVKGQIRFIPRTGECSFSVFEAGKDLFEKKYEHTYRVRDCALNNDAVFSTDSITFSMKNVDLLDLASAVTAKGGAFNEPMLTMKSDTVIAETAATLRTDAETVISTVDQGGEGGDRTRVSLAGQGHASHALVLEFDLGGVHEFNHPTR